MKKNNVISRGFTLVELLIVILLLGVVTTAIVSFFSTSQRYQKSIETEMDYQSITTNLMQRVRVELANATDIEVFERDTVDYDSLGSSDEYNYLVSYGLDVPSGKEKLKGSLVLYEYKNGARQPGVVIAPNGGTLSDNYVCFVTFKTDATGQVTVSSVINRTDSTTVDADGNTVATQPYSQSTSLSYDETLNLSNGFQNAIKYKIIE